MAKPNSRQSLIDYCLRSLGAPVIEINLDEDQIEDRVDEALQFYQEYHSDGIVRSFYKHVVTQEDYDNDYISIPEDIIVVVKYKNISEISPVIQPDVFSVRFEFDWNKPYGQWMNQLLKDIKDAKETGDDEKYKTLTKQYEVWADKYLIKGSPARVMD